jgi:phosphate transport system substrate-binding protein
VEVIVLTVFLSLLACSSNPANQSGGAGTAGGEVPVEKLPDAPGAGAVSIDGSSTVYPISEAVAEEYQKAHPGARVTIGVSGTGGGFKKLCAGEVAIVGASRPIKDSEVQACADKQVSWMELPVAYDGLVVAVNPANTWVDHFTVEELKTIWAPEAQGKVMEWSDVRKGWPEEPLRLFGAGVDSGTYDYFTAAVVGKEHSSRGDYTSSEDDNVIVQGVAMDKAALGFFGYAWYSESQGKLKAVPVDDGKPDNGAGPILPSPASVKDATYQPLSRPIFIYVNVAALEQPAVQSFLTYYLTEGSKLVSEVGYIPLSDAAYGKVRERLQARTAGSLFEGHGSTVGAPLEKLLGVQQ